MSEYDYRQANPWWRAIRQIAGTRPIAWLSARLLHNIDNAVFRVTRGRNTFTAAVSGLPVIMLTTTGARTGQARTLPIVGLPAGDRIVVIASNYGQRHNPGWYYNLLANPRATVVADGATTEVEARVLRGDEREQWFRRGIEIYPGWIQYRRRATHRHIPVIMLVPRASADI
jgi:deazaflavin-dependent oxidoreductase (nitroreductase family)